MARFRCVIYTDLSVLVKLWTPILILWSSAVVVSWSTDISLSTLTRDPVAVLGGHPFVGFFSNLGVLLWCASASVCLFSFAILRQRRNNQSFSSFFLLFGCFTFVLLLDDLFLIHEVLAPSLYIPEKIILTCYFVLLFTLLNHFKKIINRTRRLMLIAAFFCFVASIFLDLILVSGVINGLFEDMFKLLGIVSWLGYFSQVGFQVLNNSVEPGCLDSEGQARTKQAVTWLNSKGDPDKSRRF
jgi:hypothetical protein